MKKIKPKCKTCDKPLGHTVELYEENTRFLNGTTCEECQIRKGTYNPFDLT